MLNVRICKIFFVACLWTINSQVVNVGVLLQLTGPGSPVGITNKKAIEAGLDFLKKQDERFSKIKLIFEDSQDLPQTALSAYSKLKNVDNIQFLLTLSTAVATPLVGRVNQDRIVHLCFLCWGEVTTKHDDYNFRLDVDASLAADFVVKTLKSRGVKKFAVLGMGNRVGTETRARIRARIACEENLKLVYDSGYLLSDKDFKSLALKLKNQKPEYVFIVEYRLEFLSLMLDAFKSIDWKPRAGTLAFWDGQKNPPPVDYETLSYGFNPTSAQMEGMIKHFEILFGEKPRMDHFPYLGFQSMLIAGEIILACNFKNVDDCFRRKMSETVFDTVFGRMKFTKEGAPDPDIPLRFESFSS